MVVITLTDTPPKVRGDLSKWLLEVNTGVYVGNISKRVREELWERICDNLQNGRATMVYNTQGEQKMDFQVYNSAWEPVDYDGIKLMRHPTSAKEPHCDDSLTQKGFSKAAKRSYAAKRMGSSRPVDCEKYTVLDIETTGLSFEEDCIIEVAALHIVNGEVTEEFCRLVQCDTALTDTIIDLTGITDQMLADEGEPVQAVFDDFIPFISSERIVCHNAAFDLNFIQRECLKLGMQMPRKFKMIDTMKLARRKIKTVTDYKLKTLGTFFDLDTSGTHRALRDCYLTYSLYEKLKEIG